MNFVRALFTFGLTLITVSSVAKAQPNLTEGKRKFQFSCAQCHGPEVYKIDPPILFGQNMSYIYRELLSFQEDIRVDHSMSFMNQMAKNLTEQDIENLAAYLNSMNSCLFPAQVVDTHGGNIGKGQILAQEKNCIGCHFAGNTLNAPIISGQKTIYIWNQMKSFKNGDRKGQIMNGMVSGFSDTDLLDLAAYFNSLRKCP